MPKLYAFATSDEIFISYERIIDLDGLDVWRLTPKMLNEHSRMQDELKIFHNICAAAGIELVDQSNERTRGA